MNIFKLLFFIFAAFSSNSFSISDNSSKPFEGFSLGLTTSLDLKMYPQFFYYFPFFGPHLNYNYYTHRDSYIHFSAYFSRATRLISRAFDKQFDLYNGLSIRYRIITGKNNEEGFEPGSLMWVVDSLPDIFLGSSFLLNKSNSLGFGASFVNMAMGVFIKHSVNLSGNLFISFMMNYSYFIVELLNPAEQELSFYISVNYNF